jgi:DNA-binding NtrC family response regulator
MRKKVRVLVVDDEELVRFCLMDWLQKDGYAVDVATNGAEALDKARSSSFDMLLSDIVMPVMGGIKLLEEMRREDPDVPIVMMTAHGSVDSAVEAMQKGASDYLQKPFDPEQLRMKLKQVWDRQTLLEENRRCRLQLKRLESPFEMLAVSRAMADVFDLIADVSATEANVLVCGESGTGKEMVAREIHRRSQRKDGPFVAVNFGALPEGLAESELFGHEKGAFTGAAAMKRGLVELAHQGTLFLDEIGEASQKTQVDLLRFLQEKTFLRIGGTQTIEVDVRIVAATNRDIEKAVEEGKFRQDLYYRLNVIRILIPPLRDRKEDVPVLAEKFLAEFSAETKKSITRIAPEAMQELMAYHWPGNVRELRNAIERAVVVAKGAKIFPGDLPDFLRRPTQEDADQSLDALEKRHIQRKLDELAWNMSKTAEVLGIDRTTLYAKVKKYNLSKE